MSLASPSRCGSVLSWHEVHPTLLCLSYIAMVSGHVPRVLKPRFFLSRSKKQSLGTMWMWDVYNMYPPLLCDKPQWHIRGRGLCSCGHTRCNHGRCRRVCVSSVPALLFLPRSAVWGGAVVQWKGVGSGFWEMLVSMEKSYDGLYVFMEPSGDDFRWTSRC